MSADEESEATERVSSLPKVIQLFSRAGFDPNMAASKFMPLE